MYGPAGAFSDKASHQIAERVDSNVAGYAHRIERGGWPLAKQLAQEAPRAATSGQAHAGAEQEQRDDRQPDISWGHGGQCAESRRQAKGLTLWRIAKSP